MLTNALSSDMTVTSGVDQAAIGLDGTDLGKKASWTLPPGMRKEVLNLNAATALANKSGKMKTE